MNAKQTVTIGVFVKKVTYGILANVIVSVKKPDSGEYLDINNCTCKNVFLINWCYHVKMK